MMPTGREPRAAAPEAQELAQAAGPIPVEPRIYRWYHKVGAVLLLAVCVEIGLFLLIYPWTPYWETNYFSSLVPEWRRWWLNSYFRGAISGFGMADLYISLLEVFRLRRFAKRR